MKPLGFSSAPKNLTKLTNLLLFFSPADRTSNSADRAASPTSAAAIEADSPDSAASSRCRAGSRPRRSWIGTRSRRFLGHFRRHVTDRFGPSYLVFNRKSRWPPQLGPGLFRRRQVEAVQAREPDQQPWVSWRLRSDHWISEGLDERPWGGRSCRCGLVVVVVAASAGSHPGSEADLASKTNVDRQRRQHDSGHSDKASTGTKTSTTTSVTQQATLRPTSWATFRPAPWTTTSFTKQATQWSAAAASKAIIALRNILRWIRLFVFGKFYRQLLLLLHIFEKTSNGQQVFSLVLNLK